MAFLYTIFDNPFARKALETVDLPNYITDNLKYRVRPYQTEAFKRYIYADNEDFEGKPSMPYHLLYNMATGSGKTLVMAGLMLYLYEKGYRNFLFFVNSNNIITKTKDNFLNPQSSKYLFSQKIVAGGKDVVLKEVANFEEADGENINIHFTTIQQLHIDLTDTKENSVTYEDFQDKKIALIADEAHHLSSATKNQTKLDGSWEGTVMEILNQNIENILLEFTATLDYESVEIVKKYQDKVIYKYDLAQFRLDGYSKEINLIRSQYGERERIIQALVLNLYRQELATSHNINLKPVILFKAKQKISESERNKVMFHQLIDDFDAAMVEQVAKTSTVGIVQKAFVFFEQRNLSASEIAKRIKANFREENCLSANNDKEAEKNQMLLNTLEDENNPIRAVFAVQKLNEGWDVLNLFDIVRLYEGQNTGGSNTKVGKTTLSEAQLIGRGARYFPFALEEGQDKYTRKYDEDFGNDLKTLEELYYHTKEDSRYISELKKALIESGIYEDEENTVQLDLFLKDDFKKTDFYKSGKVYLNKKEPKTYDNVKGFKDLGVVKSDFAYILSSGTGAMSAAFSTEEVKVVKEKLEPLNTKISEIPQHIVRYALARNPFFYFDSITRYFPLIESVSNFITSKEYLGGIEMVIYGTQQRLDAITNEDYFQAVLGVLAEIESEIKKNLTVYQGSAFFAKKVHEVFTNKQIKLYKDSPRTNGQESVVNDAPWYVYNANYGTQEEKDFVVLFQRRFENLKKVYDDIYLIRNERELKIINKNGQAFEPDFVLFCKQKKGKNLTYQVFIEPKGMYLKAYDQWKEDFLIEVRDGKDTVKIESDKYIVTAVPFYNKSIQKDFKESFDKLLGI